MIVNKKDYVYFYMLRNAVGTLCVAFLSFVLSFTHFYQCTFIEAVERIFVYNIYTTLYFILLWVFDYLVFELTKIIYDSGKREHIGITVIVLVVLNIVFMVKPVLDLFQYNLLILSCLIGARMLKQILFKLLAERHGTA